ncbi:MAG: DUF1724 domain-containing protein [Candidatus Bathyarchaeota archaeon]|nr:DUF1724 domain-containing protein [Candidatus Bathyarchaeota archaeon]
MQSLCDLMFELSNMDRVRMLLTLLQGPENITAISRKLNITTQETSRHITRLSDVGLVSRTPDGTYRITSYGKIVFNQVSGIEFLSEHKDYFIDHTMEALPYEFVSRLGDLKNSSYIGNVMTVFQKIQEISDEAEEYILRITDKRLNIVYPNIQKAADRGVEYRRIEPDTVNESPLIEIKPPVTPGTVRSLESVDVFMAISEKEVGGLAFPRLDGEFDYLGFTSKDPQVIKWCSDIFKYYWDRGKPKVFNYKA